MSRKQTVQELSQQFDRDAEKLGQGLALLKKPEWLGEFENLQPEFRAVEQTIGTMRAHAGRFHEEMEQVDAQLTAGGLPAAQRTPLEQKRTRLESEAAAFYVKNLPRLSQELHDLCNAMLAEYHVEREKLADHIETADDARTTRREIHEALNEVDDLDPIRPPRKSMLQRKIEQWEEFVFKDGEPDTYDTIAAGSPVLKRMEEVPGKFQAAVLLMTAGVTIDNAADDMMSLFEQMRDRQRQRPGKS